MLNIVEIDNTIQELENGNTTFDACLKLASLYIVKEHYFGGKKEYGSNAEDMIIKEYKDILPEYHKYVDIKTKYQLGELSEKAVETQIQRVCVEISEFIHTLYTGTDMPSERMYIRSMLDNLQNL